MDGIQSSSRSNRGALRSVVCASVAIALLVAQQTLGDTPRLFSIERLSLPIDADPISDRSGDTSATTGRPKLVRPHARLIDANRTRLIAVRSPATTARTTSPVSKLSDPTSGNRPAVGKSPRSIDEALDIKGSVTFRKTPLSEAVFLLSDLWHINIVAGENIGGEVSGAFHDAPLREVLSAALGAAGYSYRQTGSSLVVLPIDQVGADDPSFVTETVPLPAVLKDDDSTIEAAELLLSDRGQLRKIGDSAVLVVDTAKRVARVRQLFADLTPVQRTDTDAGSANVADTDQTLLAANSTGEHAPPAITQSGIAYFTPQFTEAEEMAIPLREAMGDTVVVAVYPEENRIMVRGSGDDLRIATEAIAQLDRPRPQVRITAMIYDVALGELERLGVDWAVTPHSSTIQALSPSDDTLVFRNTFDAASSLISDPTASGAATLALRTLNSTIDARSFLQALSASSESKLLADPSITVGDRRLASIRIVQRIPIVVADPIENSAVAFSSVQFEDAGVILNVTPRISRDGTIEMKVSPEYSVVVDFIDNNPVIDSRTAETTLRVQNGHMFVLGGLRQKSVNEIVRGVPFLKDIKYVGKLFRAHETQIRESELIVFIKPELVLPDHFGEAREAIARCVTQCDLAKIAHADDLSQLPFCGNPHCPNHAPRPRVNRGSIDLPMLGGSGVLPYQVDVREEVEIIDPNATEDDRATAEELMIEPEDQVATPPELSEQVYPPVHIDPRVE